MGHYGMKVVMDTPHHAPQKAAIKTFHPCKPAFLAALRAGGSPARACEAAKVDRRWAYRVRAADAGFAEEWDDALAGHADDLKAEAVRRAVHGVRELVLYQGRPVLTWLTPDGRTVLPHTPGAVAVPLTRLAYSDKLLMRLLAAAMPEAFGRGRAGVKPEPGGTLKRRKAEDDAAKARLKAMTDEELEAEITRLEELLDSKTDE